MKKLSDRNIFQLQKLHRRGVRRAKTCRRIATGLPVGSPAWNSLQQAAIINDALAAGVRAEADRRINRKPLPSLV